MVYLKSVKNLVFNIKKNKIKQKTPQVFKLYNMFWECINTNKQTKKLQYGDIIEIEHDDDGELLEQGEINDQLIHSIARVYNLKPLDIHRFESILSHLHKIEHNSQMTHRSTYNLTYEVIEKQGTKISTITNRIPNVVCRFRTAAEIFEWFSSHVFAKNLYCIRIRVFEILPDCFLYKAIENKKSITNKNKITVIPLFPYACLGSNQRSNPETVKIAGANIKVKRPKCLATIPGYILLHESTQFVNVSKCCEDKLENIILLTQQHYSQYYSIKHLKFFKKD